MSHVAREMQRQGFDDAAADRRRHHLARAHRAEDRPALQVADGVGEGRLARGRRGAVADQRRPARRRSSAGQRADYAEIRERHKQPRRRQAPGAAGARRAAQRFDGGWDDYAPPAPKQPGLHVFDDYPLAELVDSSTGRRSSRPGNWPAAIPQILDDAVVGAQAQRTVRATRRRCSTRIVDEKWLTAKAVFGLWPAQRASATTSVVRRRRRAPTTLHFLRQQADKPVERAELLPRRLHRADGSRQAGLDRRLRGHRRHRHRAARRALRGRPRRLQRDPAQGAGRPPGRGLRRTPAPARAHGVLGLRGRRSARQRGADRREVPRHPPCPRLSGLPRAQREGDAVPPARRRAQRRHAAHRELRDVPGRGGVGLLLLPSRQPVLRGRPGVARNRSRTTRSARACSLAQAERWLASNLDYDPE